MFYLETRKQKIKNYYEKQENKFSSLKTDPNSNLFSKEKIDKRLLKKLKKSKYEKESFLLKLLLLADNNLEDEEKVTTRVDFVKKREIGQLFIVLMDLSS